MVLYLCLFFCMVSFAQNSIQEVLKKYNSEEIPYISVEKANQMAAVVFLDARELKEYQVSHIKNAIFVGFEKFDTNKVLDKINNKNTIIVVYCSVGVRSEKIGEKLKKQGFTNVYNLFGGIFEWKNKGFKVVDLNENETEKVHVYSKEWQKYLTKGIKTL